jgi:plasmid stabilization system protein ParE
VRRIVWADEAVANLESIAAYIHDFNPSAIRHGARR